MDDDGEVFVFEVLIQEVAELRLGTDQVHTHGQVLARLNRAADLGLGSFVRAEGVQRDIDERRRGHGWEHG